MLSRFRQEKNMLLRLGIFAMLFSLVMVSSANPILAETTEMNLDHSERYQLKRDGEAFVRLDKKTGEMSICNRNGTKLICRLAADERSALQDEIALLQDRLDKMESRLEGKEFSQSPDAKSDSNKDPKSRDDKYFDEELDKVMDYSAKVLRRFFTVMKDFKEDLEKIE